ncbi:glycosyltransferase family 2 protein [Actinoplanes aureus]|uniref:Glycosyltransferase n=1 Tax=Actinoplanes aureus TaxID=2792083 RepID=A0A931CFG9_9ACTN|nr:glycosyltransferase [Actinoplanes aureus]MBG0565143.1 glycosyltransferase [Actinoplanes aureus]
MDLLLTVVVPVYAVERYLHQCLDSIRAGLTEEENDQVEVIAVDDASPDSCGALLDDYAARHGGPRVLHLAANVGLGQARNAGLAETRGRYVWFVDSDDWLPEGSVRAVLERLRATEPDVLVVDHLRVYQDGSSRPDDSSPLLRGAPTLDRLLGVQHTAWNRIMRREFLAGHDLRFPPGWYEDVAFSNPVLIAADRIDALNRVCYHYRIGRTGAITATPSARHFEVFEQYERLHESLDRLGAGPVVRTRIFSLMISHLLVVAGNEGRVHPSRRRAFFRRIAELYRQHRPDGYLPPSGLPGMRHRLVALNSYTAYAALRAGYRLAGAARRRSPEPVPAASAQSAATPQPVSAAHPG